MIRALAPALAAAVAASPVPSIAHAGVPSPRIWARASPEPVEEDAAAAFSRGEAAYAEGRYSAAVDAFGEAQRLVPHPDTAYNLGLALAKTGELLAAWDVFDGIVREADDPQMRADAESQRDRVERKLATVTLVAPDDRATCIDGSPAGKAHPTRLLAGSHQFRIGTTSRTIDLEGGHSYVLEFDVSPKAPPRDRRVGVLLGIGIAAGAGSVGLGAGGLAVNDRGTASTLGIAAVGLGTVALASTITALVLRRRKPGKPRTRPAGSCAGASAAAAANAG